MENIQIFENVEFGTIRTVVIDGEPWFVGKDVAEALGYSNTRKALADHVENEDKNTVTIRDGNKGNPNQVIINESGLYSLIFGSKLEKAKEFKHWVTSEVLPTIRRHGAYLTTEVAEKVMQDPDFMIQLITKLKEEQEARKSLEKKVEQDKPKVLFADSVATSETSILVGELAKLIEQNGYKIGQKRLFKWLRENGYLMKQNSDKNMPTQRSMDLKLFEIKETVINHSDGTVTISKTPKVTGKGQLFFINKFLNQDKEVANA